MEENKKHSLRSLSETPDEQQRRYLLVLGYLQNLALPSMFNRELTEQDYELWQKLLKPYPLKAIEYAFENWGRNGKQFPRPANILELIGVWALANKPKFKPCGNCDNGWIRVFHGRTDGGNPIDEKTGAVIRCQCNRKGDLVIEHYGQGYNTADMAWLWKKISLRKKLNPDRLSEIEINCFLDELDKKRGQTPAWRA